MKIEDSFIIYSKQGVETVLNEIREHFQYLIDNHKDEEQNLVITTDIIMEHAELKE